MGWCIDQPTCGELSSSQMFSIARIRKTCFLLLFKLHLPPATGSGYMVLYSEEEFCFLWHSQKNHSGTAKLYADLVLFGQFVQMDVSKNLSTSMCSTIHPDILKPGIGRER